MLLAACNTLVRLSLNAATQNKQQLLLGTIIDGGKPAAAKILRNANDAATTEKSFGYIEKQEKTENISVVNS